MEAIVPCKLVPPGGLAVKFFSSELIRSCVRGPRRSRCLRSRLENAHGAGERGRIKGPFSASDRTGLSEVMKAQRKRNPDRQEHRSAHAIDEENPIPVSKSFPPRPVIEGARGPLTPGEEATLAAEVQDLLHLERHRDELEEQLGRTPSIEEWAEFVGSSVFRLYARIGKGRAAKRKMVAANLPLVHSVAGRFLGKGLSHTELCQEGVLGLLKSTEKYDTSYKTKFSTYSFLWIWEGMSAAVKKFRHVLHISRTVYETAALVLRQKEEFQSAYGREPTLQELADISVLDKDTIRYTLRVLKPAKSLEGTVSTSDGDENERQVGDPDRSGRPWFHLRDNELKMDISNALNSLTPREQEVLEMRYGLDGKRPLSRAEVASLMNLTYETIRLTEKRALQKLRDIAKEDGLQAYISASFWDQ